MISYESSLHARKAVGARMCEYLPLFGPLNAHWKSHKLLSSGLLVIEELAGYLLGRRLFPFSCTILSMGRHDLVHDDPRPYGDLDSLQSKEALVGRSLVNVDSLYPSHDAS